MLVTLLLLTGLALCLFAALKDVTTLTIPNWLNLAIALTGLAALVLARPGTETVMLHVGLALATLVVGFILFSIGVFGGGDAKMIPAVVLWLGPAATLPFLAWMAIAGGVMAIVLMAARAGLSPERVPAFMRRPFIAGEGVPYAVAITAGVILAVPHAELFAEPLSNLGVNPALVAG